MSIRTALKLGLVLATLIVGMLAYMNWSGEEHARKIAAAQAAAEAPPGPPPLPATHVAADDERGYAVVWVRGDPGRALESARLALDAWRRANPSKSPRDAVAVVTFGYPPAPKPKGQPGKDAAAPKAAPAKPASPNAPPAAR